MVERGADVVPVGIREGLAILDRAHVVRVDTIAQGREPVAAPLPEVPALARRHVVVPAVVSSAAFHEPACAFSTGA